MLEKMHRNYWYDYLDINKLLTEKSEEHYEVLDATATDDLQILQRINEAFSTLNNPNSLDIVVIPINLGTSNQGTYQGSHWVGIVIKKIGTTFKAFYADSCGTPMDTSLPKLRQILENHKINQITEFQQVQQYNGYDCGPWTVFNLDSLVRTEELPKSIEEKDIEHQRTLINNNFQELISPNNSSTSNSSLTSANDEENLMTSKLGALDLNCSSSNVAITKFVINTIAYVPRRKFEEDSSDEENDKSFSNEFNFNPEDKNTYPFTTARPLHARKTTELTELPSDPTEEKTVSQAVDPFLKKLEQNGFEESYKDKLDSVSASIALNRMFSLSTRNNKSLSLELASEIESEVRYEIFGFYWQCNWYNSTGEPVKHARVRKFYKQLKKINSEKAQKFIESTENGIPVPYQELREYAKNHSSTKKLVKEFREKSAQTNIYLSLIDSDTIDFNGVYSAYLRIVGSNNPIPTVMSTGYEFPTINQINSLFKIASKVDRMIRVITVRYIPLGVYYPEPNTCILIPKESDTIPESFIDKSFSKGNSESASILRKVQNRKNATFIFSDDKPLITTIPDRAKLTKTYKTPTKFSYEFTQGASPTKDDIRSFKQVSQSHFHEKVWYDNLFINNSIIVNGSLATCKSLLAKIRNGSNEEKAQSILELKNYIEPSVVDSIVDAAKEVNIYIAKFEIDYVRSESETKLLKILKEYEISIENFPYETLLIFAQEAVLEMIEEEIIDVNDLVEVSAKILKEIFYNDEIIKLLNDQPVEVNDFLRLYEIAQSHTINFPDPLQNIIIADAIQNFIDAIKQREFSALEILDSYEEDEMYLKFMAVGLDNLDEFVLKNFDNENLVEFAIENFDIDIRWIKKQLSETDQLTFFINLAGCEDYNIEEYYEEDVGEQYMEFTDIQTSVNVDCGDEPLISSSQEPADTSLIGLETLLI